MQFAQASKHSTHDGYLLLWTPLKRGRKSLFRAFLPILFWFIAYWVLGEVTLCVHMFLV